jgi:tripartite-type tricarboxylate transporter receptor subunit TctC
MQRATALPDVPTIQEAGVPGYEVAGWYGIIRWPACRKPW